MTVPLKKIGLWLWHLLPGNPILVRVVCGKSRRSRHLWLRFGYLAVLMFVVMFVLLQFGSGEGKSLADFARRCVHLVAGRATDIGCVVMRERPVVKSFVFVAGQTHLGRELISLARIDNQLRVSFLDMP